MDWDVKVKLFVKQSSLNSTVSFKGGEIHTKEQLMIHNTTEQIFIAAVFIFCSFFNGNEYNSF